MTRPLLPVRAAIHFRHLVVAVLVAVLSACAMSPQTVTVRPLVKAPSMPIGHGTSVQVETRDERRDTILGTLGGVYQSATLETDARMTSSINAEAVRVLQSWDFVAVPVALGKPDMDRFTIRILSLEYQKPEQSVGGLVSVKCRVAVTVERGYKTYTGEYQSQRSEQVAIMGTVEGNRRIVNETVSQAVSQIFLDSKLQRFMAR